MERLGDVLRWTAEAGIDPRAHSSVDMDIQRAGGEAGAACRQGVFEPAITAASKTQGAIA